MRFHTTLGTAARRLEVQQGEVELEAREQGALGESKIKLKEREDRESQGLMTVPSPSKWLSVTRTTMPT